MAVECLEELLEKFAVSKVDNTPGNVTMIFENVWFELSSSKGWSL